MIQKRMFMYGEGEINLCALLICAKIYAKNICAIIIKKCIQKHYNMNGTFLNLRTIDVRYMLVY